MMVKSHLTEKVGMSCLFIKLLTSEPDLCSICKVMEKLVRNAILDHV